MYRTEVAIVIGSGGSSNISVELPKDCPHCGEIVNPLALVGYKHQQMDEKVAILCQCNNQECYKFFSLEYINPYGNIPYLKKYNYSKNIKINLSDTIREISNGFYEIYMQSATAEEYGLDEISGMGYRKALEFLMKDFAILNNPEDEEVIKNSFLSNVIKDYYNDSSEIQNLATASSWIGNDETHYERRNDDKSIKDLKNYLQAVVHYILMKHYVNDAQDFIK